MEDHVIIRRKRTKQEFSLHERLLVAAKDARLAAKKLPPGKERETLLRSARESEAAAAINNWICSPGLRPPE